MMTITPNEEFEQFLRRIVREEVTAALSERKEKLYTVTEAAKELRIGRSTLDLLTKQGKIKCIRITGRPMYREEEIDTAKKMGFGRLTSKLIGTN